MKIYFAESAKQAIDPYIEVGAKRFLVSYFFQRKQDIIGYILEKDPNAEILLDSGAYSAFTQNEIINVDDYITFCHTVKDKVKLIAGLDDVKDPEISKNNFDKMQKAGLDIMPTYHIYEPYSYLEHYIKNANYIAIGGLVANVKGSMKTNKRKRLNSILDILDRIPKDKNVHLFGLTDMQILHRVYDKVTSVDSTRTDQRSVYTRSYRLSGMIGEAKHKKDKNHSAKIDREEVKPIWKYSIFRWLQAEKEINEYGSINCPK
jgi:hypothetical protein